MINITKNTKLLLKTTKRNYIRQEPHLMYFYQNIHVPVKKNLNTLIISYN
jgi:hypothetical protein